MHFLQQILRHPVLTKERCRLRDSPPDILRKGLDDRRVGLMDEAFEIGTRIANRLREPHVVAMRVRHDHALDFCQ